MNFQADNYYHIYNRGNNKQRIFYSPRNYIYFIEKIKRHILPHCHLVSYCLMPNHFHFLIYTDERATRQPVSNVFLSTNALSEGLRILLSSYTKAINKQEGRRGNLFQQNTKSKPVYGDEFSAGRLQDNSLYELDCFNYIHYNPVKAGLVDTPGEWVYSSFNEYQGICDLQMCNTHLGTKLVKA